MAKTLDIFKALSDEVRLRLLRAISVSELTVAELVMALGLPQSTVSRHLKPLRDTGLATARREGTSAYYHRGEAFADPALARLLRERFDAMPGAAEDRVSVKRVVEMRRQRSREFFDRIAGSYASLTEPGGGWSALASALAVGFAGREVADLGTGEGALTLLLARYARRVTAVDLSPRMLRLVEERAAESGVGDRVTAVEGDLEALPMEASSVDAAFLSQALHHAARPEAAVREAARVLKREGWLVVLDLDRHDQEWVREAWADQWLGFGEDDLRGWMEAAGLDVVSVERAAGSTVGLSVWLAAGRKR